MLSSVHRSIFLALILGVIGLDSQFKSASGSTISFPDFSDVSAWQLNVDAAQAGAALRVTPAADSQIGSAFLLNPISLQDQNSFSAFFQFQFTDPGGIGDADGAGADGLVFALQTNSSTTTGGGGGGIGFGGILNSFGVEFDTYDNGSVDDNNGNHVGIDLFGAIDSVQLVPFPTNFNDGAIFNAWVDYDGTTDGLEVRLATTSNRPAAPLLSYALDLEAILGSSEVYVGFTSGTASGWANHDVLSFIFTDDFNPVVTSVPGPVPLLGAAVALGFSRKLRKRIRSR
jgi:hypothetical protein